MKNKILGGIVHEVPFDLKNILKSRSELLNLWNNLTPIARNEWICWINSVKKPETKKLHIERLCNDIFNGKKRPCCWSGCKHRNLLN